MKILFSLPINRPLESKLEYFGGEMRFIEVGKRWIQQGHEVHLIGTEYACHLCEKHGFNPVVYQYKPFLSVRALSFYGNVKRALSKVTVKDFDFIYSDEAFSHTLTSVLMKKRLGVPLVITVALLCPEETSVLSSLIWAYRFSEYTSTPSRLRDSLQLVARTYFRNLLLRKIDLMFAVSSEIRGLLRKIGVSNERIHVVGPGLDFDYIRNVGSGSKRYDACFLGRIQPRKGVFDLLALWREIVKRRPDARLLIMGGGEKQYLERMKRLTLKYNLNSNIEMTGFVAEREKIMLMKQSKLFIFPSYSEGFAQVICEAMACGLPVIAYDLPCYREWYGDNVTYARRKDLNSLMSATLSLLEDDVLRREIGEKALKRVRQYDWDKLAKKEMDFIVKKIFNS